MLNRCCFIGNVGKDPEIRQTQAGREVANFSLAVTEKWKDSSGEKKERTEWIRVVVFNEGLAGVVKRYVKKGSKLYLEGQLQTRKWQDKNGNDQYSTEVVLQGFGGTLVLLGDPAKQEEAKPAKQQEESSFIDLEIPF